MNTLCLLLGFDSEIQFRASCFRKLESSDQYSILGFQVAVFNPIRTSSGGVAMEAKQQEVVNLFIQVGSSENEHQPREDVGVTIPGATRKCDNKVLDQAERQEKTGQMGHCENRHVTRWNGIADSPLDLTLHLPKKRKLAESDWTNCYPRNKSRESIKRNRPSVISFATRKSHQMESSSTANPEEHFIQALGPRVYNMIYGNTNAFNGTLQDGRCSLERTPISDDVDPSAVDEHFKKSLGEKTWMEVQGY